MDKYEYRLKAEQIEKLVKKQDYKTAAKIADTIDWSKVKNLNMLYVVSEIYEKNERYEDCMEILNIAYDRAPVGRMLLYKMTDMATRMHDFEEAISLYREFVKMAPHDQSRYILKYQIYRERGSSVEDQIKILSEYKTHEYQEKWAYELAYLYAEAGMQEECVRECDELILWFSEGEYVTKALELKMHYEPLTASQQEKYDHRFQASQAKYQEDDYEEYVLPSIDIDKFSTINLQAELAANLDEVLKPEPEIEMEELEMPELELEVEELELPELELEVEELEMPELELEVEELEMPELESEAEEPTEDEIQVVEEELPEIEEIPETEEEIPFIEEIVLEEELMVEKQITGQMTIDDVLAEWETKKAETEAILEANAEQQQERKERVKQETAELMKLLAGFSDDIHEDVQQILTEIDQEKESQNQKEDIVTEDDIPDMGDLEIPEIIEEEDIMLEDFVIPEEPENVEDEDEEVQPKRIRVTGDTGSMIRDLESFLEKEVSEMAISAGHLTKEQARLFAYFTSVKGMSQQLSVLFKGEPQTGKKNSASGNLVITGKQGNGKTTLAIDIVKALQKQNRIEGKRLAKISGQKLSTKDVQDVLSKLKGGALIIESAGGLTDTAMMSLSLAMEGNTEGLLIILEDSAEEIQRLFYKNKNFASKFDHTIDIPAFSNDELVAFGKSYALEQEYVFDEFGVLALYDKIGSRQTNDHLVTVAEVKDIIDGAIEHAEKGSVKHLFEKVTKKSVDEFGNHLLREEDFV